MILVIGATGRVGTRVIPMLLAKGHTVRAMTRSTEKAEAFQQLGAEVVQGDLRDPVSLARACQGAEKVLDAAHGFSPGDPTNNIRTVDEVGKRNLIRAVQDAGVKHYVFVSILGARPDASMELFRAKYATEQALKASGLAYTIVRASAFMEFWAAMVGEPILRTGKTTVFGPGVNPINFVSADDVAKFCAIALEDPRALNQSIEVGGPENLSFNQVVGIFEQVSGRKAKVNHVPLPMMRVMRVVMRPINPLLSTQVTGGIVMATEDQTFDMRQTLQQYPMTLTRLEEVARRMAASIRAGAADGGAHVMPSV